MKKLITHLISFKINRFLVLTSYLFLTFLNNPNAQVTLCQLNSGPNYRDAIYFVNTTLNGISYYHEYFHKQIFVTGDLIINGNIHFDLFKFLPCHNTFS